MNKIKKEKNEIAIFAAGCFWGVQAIFDQIQGVISTTVGYTGGKTNNPSYKEVCSGNTGHAEAVKNHTLKYMACQLVWFLNTSKIIFAFSRTEVGSLRKNNFLSIKIEFYPKEVTYEKLLNLFWMNHDPTTLNRQGPDIGDQYRSAVFYINSKQKNIALKSRNEHQKKIKKPILTEIVKFSKFYPAEDYHQKYYQTHKITCPIKYE